MKGFSLVLAALFGVVAHGNIPRFSEYSSKNKVRQEVGSFRDGADTNEQPVIGIVSQTLESEMKNDTRFSGYKSYIMTAYT